MHNLNFASNENFAGAKKALSLLCQKKQWQAASSLEELRKNLAKKFTVENDQVYFTLAARSALYLFLKSLKLAKNSEVLLQAFTCEAVVLPVLATGLIPQYVDIEQESWSMDFRDLKKKIGQNSRVLILQHSFTMLPRDRAKILQLAKKQQLIVIEDLAHGFAPELLKDQSNSTSKLLSFGRSKFFNAVFGGAIIVEEKHLNQQFQESIAQLKPVNNQFINKALLYKIFTPILKTTYSYGGKLFHAVFNYLGIFSKEISDKEKEGDYDNWLNKSLPNVFATLLLDQVRHYQSIYDHRQQLAQLYWQQFPQQISQNNLPALRYPLIINRADAFVAHMTRKGYILGNWYRQVVAPPGLDLNKVKYQEGSCPQAEKMCQRVVNLPLNLSVKEAKKLLAVLKNVKQNFN
jgi:dTDP-4-amino-4,6-dideoxygalactose transaminase